MSNHLSKEGNGKTIFFALSSSHSENLISEKLGICNYALGPVSRDRRILVKEMEVGEAGFVPYNMFTANILTQFCITNDLL